MTIEVAKYTFSSWLRRGIGARINETDTLGTGPSAVTERATVPVDVQINAQAIHKDFALLGPGDVIGVNATMVVRTEPKPLITNFEPNYLPFVEFYDEDFAWRYTPAKANGRKLRPWIVLLVLKVDEFTKDARTFPLPTLTVTKAAALPPPEEIWAWAHAHVNEGHPSTTAFEAFLKTLSDLDDPNADKIICRLMCPRRLDANTAYRAFVVPAFETGRLAGLGEDPTGIDAQKPSWDAGAANVKLPIYFEWTFSTGEDQDFESLVKLLEPRVMDARVGIRDMDGARPGFGLMEPTDLGPPADPAVAPWIVGLEGALKAPTTTSRPPVLDTTRPFFPALAAIVNFPADLAAASNVATDPVVSPPIYGENHALEYRLDVTKAGWLHGLNKDPRNRVPAGFGTNVVQKDQDDYVARAWQQVQRILDANRRLLHAAFSMQVADAIRQRVSARFDAQKKLVFFSPLLRKIKGSPTTLQRLLRDSRVPPAAVSPAFRRLIRPRGPHFKRFASADPAFGHGTLIDALNSGTASAAPPRVVPTGIRTDDALADAVRGRVPGGGVAGGYRWWLVVLLIVIALVLLFSGLWITALIVAAVAYGVWRALAGGTDPAAFYDSFTDPKTVIELVQSQPPQPAFALAETDDAIAPPVAAGTTVTLSTDTSSTSADATTFTTLSYFTPGVAGADSVEAKNFRFAAIALERRLTIVAPVVPRLAFDLANATTKIDLAVDPRIAFPRQLATLVLFSFDPRWLLQPEHLVPAMAYPDFEDPMYAKLRDISPELLLPNLSLIPPNTISLLVTNPVFIESYMVGLNHEFGRELLWREYPTDERGSYFRQFWDVKGIISNPTNLPAEQLVEAWKDITPLDTWGGSTLLGSHNRAHGEDRVVLVVRGELLKKYPRTIIYAQKAHIYKDPKTGVADPTKDPVIVEVATDAEMAAEIRFPLFKAEIDPDYKFFGFDLTIPQARGADHPQKETDDWGWYFVIQQIPGEPRFGMDIAFDPDDDPTTPITWDDLAWDRYDPTLPFIEASRRPLPTFVPAGPDSIAQWGTDSATMAYILYQKPVMIAIHAREMLANVAP